MIETFWSILSDNGRLYSVNKFDLVWDPKQTANCYNQLTISGKCKSRQFKWTVRRTVEIIDCIVDVNPMIAFLDSRKFCE